MVRVLNGTERGCAAPSIPTGASVSRVGDTAIVQCVTGRERWQLTCDNDQWRGATMTNCTSGMTSYIYTLITISGVTLFRCFNDACFKTT